LETVKSFETCSPLGNPLAEANQFEGAHADGTIGTRGIHRVSNEPMKDVGKIIQKSVLM
jgi:hypothetical protein